MIPSLRSRHMPARRVIAIFVGGSAISPKRCCLLRFARDASHPSLDPCSCELTGGERPRSLITLDRSTSGALFESQSDESTLLSINALPDTPRRRPVTHTAAKASAANEKRSSSAQNRNSPEAPFRERRARRRQELAPSLRRLEALREPTRFEPHRRRGHKR